MAFKIELCHHHFKSITRVVVIAKLKLPNQFDFIS